MREIMTTGFLAIKVGESKTSSFLFARKPEPGKNYRFQVRAVDNDGLVSSNSEMISIMMKSK